ncbi:IS3 family transposase [Streptomyces sp. NPDC091376]|uniref:IS3 family transposase n=1 Tax=Streptomyces sp. NPDC091376 TaxID=3365994 RepID=UPI0038108CD1
MGRPLRLTDAELKTQIGRVHVGNLSVYGSRRCSDSCREGVAVARYTVARLMRDLGLEGARCGRKIRATIRDDKYQWAADLLQRDFTEPQPNERWVADPTYVATWLGIVYVALVADSSSTPSTYGDATAPAHQLARPGPVLGTRSSRTGLPRRRHHRRHSAPVQAREGPHAQAEMHAPDPV